nr:hypothetical protein [Mycobacterium saskatchewanense]
MLFATDALVDPVDELVAAVVAAAWSVVPESLVFCWAEVNIGTWLAEADDAA